MTSSDKGLVYRSAPSETSSAPAAGTFEALSPLAKSTLCRLFLGGPLHDDRAEKFKTGPAELRAAGMADRWPPWTFLTHIGVAVGGRAKVTDKHWLYKQAGG